MPDKWDGTERRKYPRAKLGLLVEVWPRDAKDKVMQGKMRNIGAGGIALLSRINLPAGTLVELSFQIAEGVSFANIKGTVVRSEAMEEQHLMIVAYPDLSAEQVDKIDNYIGSLRFLRRLSIFKTLSDEEIRLLLQISKEEQFPEGKTLFLEGMEGDAFYIVRKGAVKVVKRSKEGKEEPIAMIREGEFFGEMALLDDVPRSATAVTNRPSVIKVIRRADFLRLLDADRLLGNKLLWIFIKGLCRKVRDADRRMADLFFTDSTINPAEPL